MHEIELPTSYHTVMSVQVHVSTVLCPLTNPSTYAHTQLPINTPSHTVMIRQVHVSTLLHTLLYPGARFHTFYITFIYSQWLKMETKV